MSRLSQDRLESLPVVGRIFAIGPEQPAIDLLIILGPVVIVTVAILGRRPVTTALAAGYLLAFLGAVLYIAWTRN